MGIYLVSREHLDYGYDEYIAFVVYAKSPKDARRQCATKAGHRNDRLELATCKKIGESKTQKFEDIILDSFMQDNGQTQSSGLTAPEGWNTNSNTLVFQLNDAGKTLVKIDRNGILEVEGKKIDLTKYMPTPKSHDTSVMDVVDKIDKLVFAYNMLYQPYTESDDWSMPERKIADKNDIRDILTALPIAGKKYTREEVKKYVNPSARDSFDAGKVQGIEDFLKDHDMLSDQNPLYYMCAKMGKLTPEECKLVDSLLRELCRRGRMKVGKFTSKEFKEFVDVIIKQVRYFNKLSEKNEGSNT